MATYYLAPTGDDAGDGSASDPWFTLEHADGQISTGDTIEMAGGTYDYGAANIQRLYTDGSSDSECTVTAAAGETPVLDWGGRANAPNGGGWSDSSHGGIRVYGDHWVFDGLELRRSPYMGFRLEGANCTVRNCTAHAIHLVGFFSYGANNTFENCTAYDCYGSTSSGGDSDGFQFYSVSSGTARNCASYDNSDDGFDCWESTGVAFERCRAYSNGRDGGDGNGFKLGGGSSSGNITAQRCLSWENSSNGFTYNGATQADYFYNNTAWNNGFQGYAFSGSDEAYNNIAYRNATATGGSTPAAEGTNTWNLGIGDPMFASTDPSTDEFLRPASNSPVIDAGTDVGLSYSGDAPDLGALEVGQSDDDASTGGSVYYHDGSGWKRATVRYHDGSGWQRATLRHHDGQQFV